MSDIVITEGDKPLENSTEETVAVDSAAEIAAQATNTAVKTLEVAKEIAAETSKNDLIAAMIDQRLSEMRTAFDVALSEMNSRLGQISDALTALAISEAEEVEEVEEVEEKPAEIVEVVDSKPVEETVVETAPVDRKVAKRRFI